MPEGTEVSRVLAVAVAAAGTRSAAEAGYRAAVVEAARVAGVSAVAAELGVSRQAVRQLVKRAEGPSDAEMRDRLGELDARW